MNLHVRKHLGRWAVIAAVALAVSAQAFVGVTPAYAGTAKSPAYFDRKAVMARAKTWVDKRVPYSQTGWLNNYRTDCSGFVSMAWGLDQSYVTWSLPEVARPIHKEELLPGDIILNLQRHVVIFGGWANSKHTAYVVYEQAGTPHKAIKRVVRYPYDTVTSNSYKPYRYVGGHNLKEPGNTLPTAFMATYAGRGQVLVPGVRATRTNVKLWRIAQKRTVQNLEKKRAAARVAANTAAAKAAGKTAAKTSAKAAEAKSLKLKADKAAEGARAAAGAKAAAKARQAALTRAEAKRAAIDERPPAMKLLQGLLALITR